MQLKTFTIKDIRSWKPAPCYDPGKYLPPDWSGTALDILNIEACPAQDRIWVVLHEDAIDEMVMHSLACDFAEEVLPIWEARAQKNEYYDVPRNAIATKRRWIAGECSDEELEASWEAAWGAAWVASREAFREASREASWEASWEAARAAAWGAAWAASREAAGEASWEAAWASSWAASGEASGEAAREAAGESQVGMIRKRLTS